jgi:hypothetical protein
MKYFHKRSNLVLKDLSFRTRERLAKTIEAKLSKGLLSQVELDKTFAISNNDYDFIMRPTSSAFSGKFRNIVHDLTSRRYLYAVLINVALNV